MTSLQLLGSRLKTIKNLWKVARLESTRDSIETKTYNILSEIHLIISEENEIIKAREI